MKKINNRHLPAIILGFVVAFGLAIVFFLQSPLFEVELKTAESTLEIGQAANSTPSYYLDGAKWCVSLSTVDTSSVKTTKVGRYPIYIYHGFQKYTSYVNVCDNTAPEVSCDIKNKTVKAGDILSAASLGIHADDHSGIETIQFTRIASTKFYTGLPDDQTAEIRELYRKGIPIQGEKFQFAYGGIYTMTISVSDTFQNTTDVELIVTVDTPPVIEAPKNFYVADTPQIDFTKYIRAWDFIDGEVAITDIEIDTSQLKLSTPGKYPVSLSVTDSYGLTTTKITTVHVNSQDALQSLLNEHAVNPDTDVIIGVKNAHDSGYYKDDNIVARQKSILPCVAHIQNDALESFGSGFIIEINDKFVTLVTNEHVIKRDLIVDITFFDGKHYSGSVVAADAKLDIAFIRIPIDGNDTASSIPSDYVQKLRTVHINKGYWDNLADDCKLAIAYSSIDGKGEVWSNNIGYIVEKEALRNWNQYKDVNETIISFEPVSGTSGSALIDGHGQLIGMMRGYTEYPGYIETVAVPLNSILSYFEAVFKYKIHYQ